MSGLTSLWKKPTPKEQVRVAQRELRGNTRDLERELHDLKRQEAALVKEIKAAANKGNMPGARILAQQLVRMRGQMTKLQKTRATLQGVSVSVATAASTAAVGQTLGTAGKAMAAVGQAADPRKMQQQMGEFARQNERMGMAGEMMDDALEDALDGDEVEEETDAVVGQVLDEIGVDLSAMLQAAPQKRVAAKQQMAARQQQEEEEDADADLVARLAALK